MYRRSSAGIPAACSSVFLLTLAWSAVAAPESAAKPRATAAEASSRGEQAPVKSVQEPQPETNPFNVPDGTIDELQKYIDGLNKIQPSSSLRPAVAELHRKRATAQLRACEKILAAHPTPEQGQTAVRAKIAALLVLGRLGDKSAQAGLEATVDQVNGLGLKDMIRDVQLAALENRAEQAVAMPDVDYLKLVERLKSFLNEGPADMPSARLAVKVAMAAEQADRPKLAIRAYRELGEILAASNDVRVAGTAAPMLGAARRLDLVGKPFVLDGSTVAGRPLDWKKYRGKVVLIDFFATWCGPCRDEIPNITRCYKAYRKRGFDVVRISIDRERKAIEEYVDKEKHPWPVVLDRNEARGTDKSLATYYGIFTIPQTVLVGKDGKVLALNVRGEQLRKMLEELLGPAVEGKGGGSGTSQPRQH